jgi:Domain of unknown function (DUF4129)
MNWERKRIFREQMKAIPKVFFYLFCFILLHCKCIASPQTEAALHPIIRNVPAEKVTKYLSDSHFQYVRTPVLNTSWLDELLWRIRRILFQPLDHTYYITLWDIILFTFVVFAIVFIVRSLFKGQDGGLFMGRAGAIKSSISVNEEKIDEVDFDSLITSAESAKEYRIATRYLYLKTLKGLSIKGLISWKPDKTNRDYIYELRSSGFKESFKEVTRVFDYTWYGNKELDETYFRDIKSTFNTFNSQVYSG